MYEQSAYIDRGLSRDENDNFKLSFRGILLAPFFQPFVFTISEDTLVSVRSLPS